jgi:hypothetical protein
LKPSLEEIQQRELSAISKSTSPHILDRGEEFAQPENPDEQAQILPISDIAYSLCKSSGTGPVRRARMAGRGPGHAHRKAVARLGIG